MHVTLKPTHSEISSAFVQLEAFCIFVVVSVFVSFVFRAKRKVTIESITLISIVNFNTSHEAVYETKLFFIIGTFCPFFVLSGQIKHCRKILKPRRMPVNSRTSVASVHRVTTQVVQVLPRPMGAQCGMDRVSGRVSRA